MQTRLLVLDNSGFPLLFREDRAWFAHFSGAEITSVNIPSGQAIPALNGFTHILAGGSEASILKPKPWFDREADILRQAVDRGMPVLGSCFGHQMVVYALSGAEFITRSLQPEIGWITLQQVTDDALLSDVTYPWRTFAYHFDEATALPLPWRVLARSEACSTQIVRYGEKPVWGIQPHPEIARWKARTFLPIYRLFSRGRTRRAISISNPPPADRVARSIARRFLEQPCGEHDGTR